MSQAKMVELDWVRKGDWYSEAGRYVVSAAVVREKLVYMAWFNKEMIGGAYGSPKEAKDRCEAHNAKS